jgi:hypothetical protein
VIEDRPKMARRWDANMGSYFCADPKFRCAHVDQAWQNLSLVHCTMLDAELHSPSVISVRECTRHQRLRVVA